MLDIRVIYKNNQVFTSWQQVKNKKNLRTILSATAAKTSNT